MNDLARVTHRNIAEKCGCSRATVSLALSGSARISAEVREQIRRIADEMGYRPDPTLAMLARNRFSVRANGLRSTLAYVVDKKDRSSIALQEYHLAAAKNRAELRGYQLFEFDLGPYPTGESASKVLYHRGVQGIVIPSMPREAETYFHASGWDRFSVVCCSIGWVAVPFHTVNRDIFEGARLVWREVAKRGYRRVGGAIFRHDPVAVDDYGRFGASLVEQHELFAAKERIPLLRCDPHDKAAFLAWFERYRPDAIVSFISEACDWLEEAGYRVPRDVAFACMGTWPHERYAGLNTLDAELGQVAVDFLISQMQACQQGAPSIQQTVLLKPRWQEGLTLPHRRP